MNDSNDNYHYHSRVQSASTLFHSLYLWFYLWFTSTYLFCTVATHDLSKMKTVFSENSNFDFFSIKFFLLSPGFVLEKKTAGKEKTLDASEQNSNCWEARAKFHDIKYWNHDTLPSKDDSFYRCFHWFSVANAVSFA